MKGGDPSVHDVHVTVHHLICLSSMKFSKAGQPKLICQVSGNGNALRDGNTIHGEHWQLAVGELRLQPGEGTARHSLVSISDPSVGEYDSGELSPAGRLEVGQLHVLHYLDLLYK